ncbi:MAG TPA: hypothetical protein VJU82_02015 [Acidobacteriaceae bacterium]|nr:hypothetical protein [Acidobacteriaceae bacterium]
MQIIVATLAFGEIPYLRYTEAINRRYCARHGLCFHVLRPEAQVLRSPIWFKVSGVRELLSSADYVLFVDADAYFVDHSRTIEALIAAEMGTAVLLFGADRRDRNFAWSDTNANAGVFLVRNCPQAFEILNAWWESPLQYDRRWLWTWPPEQGSMNAHIRAGPFASSIKVIHYAHMNGADGTFIRHLIGFSEEQRLAILREDARRLLGWPAVFHRFSAFASLRLRQSRVGQALSRACSRK